MSVVGEIGVIIGLITGTIEIVKSTKNLYSAFKDAKGQPKEFRSIAAKFPLLLEILRKAETDAQQTELGDGVKNEAASNIKACKEKVEALNKIFKAVLREDDDNWLERYKKAIVGLSKGKRAEELMREIMEHIELVTCDKLMGTSTREQIEKLQEAIQEMLDMPSSIPENDRPIIQNHSGSGHNNNILNRSTNNNSSTGVQQVNNGGGTQNYNAYNYYGSEKSITLKQSLYFPEMDNRRNDISKIHVGNICEWLCDEQDYKDWLARSQKLLWIVGKPGSGKSTIMNYICPQDTSRTEKEDTEKLSQPQKKLIVASFFCHTTTGAAALQNNRTGLFRTLLHQILGQIPTLPSEITSEFDKKCELQGKHAEKWEWHEHELEKMLQASISYIAKEYSDRYVLRIYVDALDEFSSNEPNGSSEPRDLAEYLQRLTLLGIDLYVCISCRNYRGIAKGGFTISIGNKNHQDITTYVENKLSGIKGEGDETQQLINWIVENASGIFQWAAVVVEKARSLNEYMDSSKRIFDALKDLPQGLDNLYKKGFQTMDTDRQFQSLQLLRWICSARRPLSVEELYDAMEISSSVTTPRKPVAYKTYRHEMMKKIQVFSCDLAVVNDHGKYTSVELSHKSVRDYLASSGLQFLNGSDPASSSPTFCVTSYPHLRLLGFCVDYLSSNELHTRAGALHAQFGSWGNLSTTPKIVEKFDDDYPLFGYVVGCWGYHAKEVENENVRQKNSFEGELLQLYHRLIQIPPEKLTIIFSWCKSQDTDRKTLLHVASRDGLPRLVELIIDTNVMKRSWWQTLSGVTVANEWLRAVTPLSLAVSRGHKDVAELLLQRTEIDVNEVDECHNTPLLSAATRGDEGMVALLLRYDNVDVNAKHRGGPITVLMATVEMGYEGIVALLIRHPKIKLNAKDNWGETALSCAVYRRNEGMVRVLLEHGKADIDISTRDEYNFSPLMNAIEKGPWTIVELLLKEKRRMSKEDRKIAEALETLSPDEKDRMIDDMKKAQRSKRSEETLKYISRLPRSGSVDWMDCDFEFGF